MIHVIVPSRTSEYLDALMESMEKSETRSSNRCTVVWNGPGLGRPKFGYPYVLTYGDRPFVFAKAINAGAAKAPMDDDLLILNDDTTILTSNWLTALERELECLYTRPYGMISLQIRGGCGNPEQQESVPPGSIARAFATLCFVAVVIRRATWNVVGPLDERFSGYGWDDDDYNRRVKSALVCLRGVTSAVVVAHGKSDLKLPHSGSYARYFTQEEHTAKFLENKRIFEEKWEKPVEEEKVAPTEPNLSRLPPPRPIDFVIRRCLNIGCGDKPKASTDAEMWVNLNLSDGTGVDVIRDIRRGLPFDSASFDHVLMDNVLEHFDSDDAIFVLNEIDRVLRVRGTALIIVPHKDSQGAVQDPTHRSQWVPRSVIYWNQKMSPYGGKFVGITANLLPLGEPKIEGDMKTEAFIHFRVRKEPL